MIYKFLLTIGLALLLSAFKFPEPGIYFVSSLDPIFPTGLQGIALLLLRVGVGVLFLIHGYPKVTHLKKWAKSIKMPIFLCFLSAWSMLGSGIFLILGLLTLLATLPLFASMLFAIYLHISENKFFVSPDPYLIPEGEYEGPKGKAEVPSWEKAFMYCIMLIAIAVFGPGIYSLDALIFK